MPMMVRFAILNDKLKDAFLAVCRSDGITPEQFAEWATVQKLNEVIHMANERARVAAENAAAEGETTSETTQADTQGDTTEASSSEDVTTPPLATPEDGTVAGG